MFSIFSFFCLFLVKGGDVSLTVHNDTAMKDVEHGTSSLQVSLFGIFSRSDCSSFFLSLLSEVGKLHQPQSL